MSTLVTELPLTEADLDVIYHEPEPDPESVEFEAPETEFDEGTLRWMQDITQRCMSFLRVFCDVDLFPYQEELAESLILSILLGDGDEITALQSRQSGKTEVVADVIATMMVLLPRLAKAFPDVLGRFRKGFMVGVFAPTEDQASTVWSRVVDRLTSAKATEMLVDPEIDDKVGRGQEKARTIVLKSCGSLCRMQTCNPKAKIESKTYHFILVDEAQDADDYMVRKSIHPMLAFNNGSICKTGTANRRKSDFYRACQANKRRSLRRGALKHHFEYDYRTVCKFNPNYKRFIEKEKQRIGEDSDEFQMSYALKWIFDRGMFTTDDRMERLLDPSMQIVRSWWRTPVVVGVDPARRKDATVVTVCFVFWDRPDALGYYEHRVLNWLEINNEDWESQYFQIVDFLRDYNVLRIGVDTTGVGDAVASRLKVLLPDIEVISMDSDTKSQSTRWKHLMAVMQREMLVIPGHSKTRRLKVWKRFWQQMTDLEKVYQGQYMLAAAPEEPDAHDDYADSLALAVACTMEDVAVEAEMTEAPWARR